MFEWLNEEENKAVDKLIDRFNDAEIEGDEKEMNRICFILSKKYGINFGF